MYNVKKLSRLKKLLIIALPLAGFLTACQTTHGAKTECQWRFVYLSKQDTQKTIEQNVRNNAIHDAVCGK